MLVSPLDSPSEWALAPESRTLPATTRYGGRRLLGVRCTASTARAVVAPVASVARVHGDDHLLEVEPVAFLSARALGASDLGLPEFYFWLEGGDVWTPPPGLIAEGTHLVQVTGVWLGVTGQDGLTRDPRSWAAALARAWPEEDRVEWQTFQDRLEAQLPGGSRAPVILTDHRGAPLHGRRIRITLTDGANPGSRDVELLPGHDGDLQQAAAAAGLDPVFSDGATHGRLQVLALPGAVEPIESQWAGYDGGPPASASTTTVRPDSRLASHTDLHAWFADQQAMLGPGSPFGPDLARLRRGSRVTPLVHGSQAFADIAGTVRQVMADGGHVAFAGWGFHHRFDLVPSGRAERDLPADADLSLLGLTEALAGQGRSARFLVNRFLQVDDTAPLTPAALAALLLAMMILLHRLRESPVFEARLGRELGVLVGLATAFGLGTLLSFMLSDELSAFEPSGGARSDLDALATARALWSALPATREDNPLAGGMTGALADFAGAHHVGVYHQKLQLAQHGDRLVGYLGGMDINPNRLDDEHHNAERPYHDTHARIEGPAAQDVFTTFRQRWLAETTPGESLADPPPQPDAGHHVVQIARTYFRPAAAARALPFAPTGDFTLHATLLRALAEAREFIYIEDQYLTPPSEYRAALLDALSRIQKLVVVVPRSADQPFGALHRQTYFDDLVAAGGEKVHLIAPVRRPHSAALKRIAAGGRCELRESLAAAPSLHEEIALGPSARVPRSAPFWLAIDGELMYAHENVELPLGGPLPPADAREATARFRVQRGSFLPGRIATEPRAHEAGAAALVVSMDAIYVHSKLMIVDDVFLSIGSANLNRRGMFHDGELNVFAMSEGLRADPARNVARTLRMRLWADHLGLPEAVAAPLVADPIAGARLFGRSYFEGNPAMHPNFFTLDSVLELTPGGSPLGDVLKVLGMTLTATEQATFFDTIVDPTTFGV